MKKALFGLLLCALSVLPVGIEKLSASVTPSFDNGVTVEKCWYGRGWYGYRGGWGMGYGYGGNYGYSNYGWGYGYPYSYGYGCNDCCGYGYGYGCGYNSGCCGGFFGGWW